MFQLPARYTRPLSDDFESDGDRLIDLMALSWVTPEVDAPIELDEWQRWLFRHVLERCPADHPENPGELRYRQVLVSMGRQNDKSLVGGGFNPHRQLAAGPGQGRIRCRPGRATQHAQQRERQARCARPQSGHRSTLSRASVSRSTSLAASRPLDSAQMRRASSRRPAAHSTSPRWAPISTSGLDA